MRRVIGMLPPPAAAWLTAFYNKHVNVAMDAEYYQAILAGEWPSAVKQLQDALKAAKQKQGDN